MTNNIKEIIKLSYNNNAHVREKNEMQDWKFKPTNT